MPEQQHKIRWYVHSGDEIIPRTSGMIGTWPYEAKCSCGWETRTGGAVRSFVEFLVRDHKWDVEHGFWPARQSMTGERREGW